MTESTRAEFEAWWADSGYNTIRGELQSIVLGYAFEAWQAATAKRSQPTPSRQEIEDAAYEKAAVLCETELAQNDGITCAEEIRALKKGSES